MSVASEVRATDEADGAPSAVAPVRGWRRMFGDWLLVGASTAICQVLGMVTSLAMRVFLSPAQMGIWQALKLFLSYSNYAGMGISKGAARELSIAMGRGDLTEARRGLNLAFTVNTLTSVVYAIVLVGAGIWVGCGSGSAWASAWCAGLIVMGGLAVLHRHITFQVTILRSSQSFLATSRLSILEAVLTLVLGVLATWRWGLAGMYLSTLGVMLGSLVFVQRWQVARLRWAWDLGEIRRLVAIGSPILLAGAVSSLFRSLDKLMILGYLDDREHQLGCYSLALMVAAQLYGLGNMLSMVTGPRFGEKYGQSGDRRTVARLGARASELQAAAIALPAAMAILIAPPLLARMLPDYQTGLAPLVWLVPGIVAATLALTGSQYLIAVDRQGRALVAVLAATGVAALGNHVALRGGYGLVGVAVATTAANLLYFVLITAISVWGELGRAERVRYVAMHVLALGPTLVAAFCLERFWPMSETSWMGAVLKASLAAAVWLAMVGVGWWWGGWAMELRGGRTRSGRRKERGWTKGDRLIFVSTKVGTVAKEPRLTLEELERRCQKPDHRRLGNWMARHIARPAALRVTWLIAPWPISANAATLGAWGFGLAAAAAFGWGTVGGWILGAVLLNAWYLLDHVDGQLARLRGTASLDGVQLDYLMHHTVNLLVPLGIGSGFFARTVEPLWLLVGLVGGVSLLLITLQHDARYKAFMQRLKRVEGQLVVCGGGGARPQPTPPVPRRPLQLAAWAARKMCEAHVMMGAVTIVAFAQLLVGDEHLVLGQIWLVMMTVSAVAVSAWVLWRSQRCHGAEREFAAWYRVPAGSDLEFCDGWWRVRSVGEAEREKYGVDEAVAPIIARYLNRSGGSTFCEDVP